MIQDKKSPETNTGRRGLLRSLLGAGFAAPVIATFSMDALMAQSKTSPTTSTTTISNTTTLVPISSNTTAMTAGCLASGPALQKSSLPNVGYTGSMFFKATTSDISLTQNYLTKHNAPLVITNCAPGAPTRLTMSLAFEVQQNGPSAYAIRCDHFYRNDASITSSQITVSGLQICGLPYPSGLVLPTSLLGYPDLNALLEDMESERATVEISGFFQGQPFTLVGSIKGQIQPFRPVILTS